LRILIVLILSETYVNQYKLEIAVAASELDSVIETIAKTANTGKVGDGKIFVSNLER
jgi:nitrogen regulatory protein PII